MTDLNAIKFALKNFPIKSDVESELHKYATALLSDNEALRVEVARQQEINRAVSDGMFGARHERDALRSTLKLAESALREAEYLTEANTEIRERMAIKRMLQLTLAKIKEHLK